MQKIIVAGAMALSICACAKRPESIAPSYISDVGYQAWRCDQLVGETSRLESALASASAQQEKARSNDTVGVIFLGLPVSSLSGDNVAPEIARLKGEKVAMQRAMVLKNCGTAPTSASANPKPKS